MILNFYVSGFFLQVAVFIGWIGCFVLVVGYYDVVLNFVYFLFQFGKEVVDVIEVLIVFLKEVVFGFSEILIWGMYWKVEVVGGFQ